MAVVGFEVTSRTPLADGVAFGASGAYELIRGRLSYAVDPDAEVNAGIVDLALAPRNASGLVEFEGDLLLFAPLDPSRANGRLLVDVPNRGNPLAVQNLNRSGSVWPPDPTSPGDGFLFRRGFTVASVGWQWDCARTSTAVRLDPPEAQIDGRPIRGQVFAEIRPGEAARSASLAQLRSEPYPAADLDDPDAALWVRNWEDGPDTAIPRSRWRFARERDGRVEPSATDIYLDDGLRPGAIYRLVYTTERSPVVGAGLLAMRDAATFLRSGGGDLAFDSFEHVYAFGSSQSGRFLRQLLQLGLNRDEAGVVAFDGLHIHIAGGVRGEFNHRYAQPSVAHTPGFGQLPPHAFVPTSGEPRTLLNRVRERDALPRVICTNTSNEYWRGDASLLHVDPDGRSDLPEDPSVRIYHFAGTQHGNGALPQQRRARADADAGRYGLNVVDFSPLTRAAFVHLDRWVGEGVEPPPSRHPRLDDGTAVERAPLLAAFARIPGIEPLDPERLSVLRTVDLGKDAGSGVGSYPTREGDVLPCLVSAVDDGLNEVAGIRLPDLSVPVASHAGWNPRDPESGAPELAVRFYGLSSFFARSRSERETSGDARPSLEERYADEASYLDAVRRSALALVSEGYVLGEDMELVIANCAERYRAALGGEVERPRAPSTPTSVREG